MSTDSRIQVISESLRPVFSDCSFRSAHFFFTLMDIILLILPIFTLKPYKLFYQFSSCKLLTLVNRAETSVPDYVLSFIHNLPIS